MIGAGWAFVLLLVSAGPALGMEALPRLEQLLEVVASGDRSATLAFVDEAVDPSFREQVSVSQLVTMLEDLSTRHGSLIVHRQQAVGLDQAQALVQSEAWKTWFTLEVSVMPEPPHRIRGLGFNRTSPPGDLPPAPALEEEAFLAELTTLVESLIDRDLFSGAVMLQIDGKPSFQAAGGLASKRFGVPNQLDTKFNLGSMNKMFTAVAVMQLVESGEAFLDDPIGGYLDEDWLDSGILAEVEVRHLLTHTSGLGSYFNQKFMESSRTLFREVNDYKPLVREERLAFQPGDGWRYSNTGFLLAGAVIEGAAGENYFDYVRANIFEPAGMPHTDCYEMDRPVPNLAIGYSRDSNGEWRNNLYAHVLRGGPAGGGFSTVIDLLAFARGLREFELLSEESTEALWSAKPELGSATYGYGMGVSQSALGRRTGHSGGFSGINGELRMYLDAGVDVAVLSNYDSAASDLADAIELLLLRR